MNNLLYVDMDGTICVWENEVPLEEVTKRGYFLERKPIPTIISALEILESRYDVELQVLSAVFNDNHSCMEKHLWLEKNAPFLLKRQPIFVPFGENKGNYVDRSAFLLDDFSYNLHNWYRRKGIKAYNGINGTHGTWVGKPSIHVYADPFVIADKLASYIFSGEPYLFLRGM